MTTTIENQAIVTQPAREGEVEASTGDGYAAVRFNAMKHGILSRLTVLPHEDRSEFDALLSALIEEHQPSGVTEQYLVEELAAIMWRQRRVLLAEGAAINRGLHSVVHNQYDSPVPSAALFEPGLRSGGTDLPDLLTAGVDDIAERWQQAALDLAATRKAASILRKGPGAYERARRALLQDSRDWWDEQVEEAEYPATAGGLEQFIRETLEPTCIRMDQEARLIPAIQVQTLRGCKCTGWRSSTATKPTSTASSSAPWPCC